MAVCAHQLLPQITKHLWLCAPLWGRADLRSESQQPHTGPSSDFTITGSRAASLSSCSSSPPYSSMHWILGFGWFLGPWPQPPGHILAIKSDGSDWNISTTIGWIAMTFSTNIDQVSIRWIMMTLLIIWLFLLVELDQCWTSSCSWRIHHDFCCSPEFCVSEWNVLTTFGQIAIQFGAHIHVPC